jgi:hypothetical protein
MRKIEISDDDADSVIGMLLGRMSTWEVSREMGIGQSMVRRVAERGGLEYVRGRWVVVRGVDAEG